MSSGFVELDVVAAGAATSIGANLAQTSASVRAGVNLFREHPFHLAETEDPEWEEGEPVQVSLAPWIDPGLTGLERVTELALPAVREAIEAAGLRRADMKRTGLLLALPAEDDAVRGWALERDFPPALMARLGLPSLPVLATSRAGNTASLDLLASAGRTGREAGVEWLLLVAVDSLVSPDRLALLDSQWRVRSDRNTDGFIPGEGAAALMLSSTAGTNRPRVDSCGTGAEPRPLHSDKVSSGEGLSDAIRAAWAAATPPRWVLCDLDGESYRAFDWGVTVTRLGAMLADIEELTHPADCWGGVGAASGALLVATALAAFDRGWAPAHEVLIWTAADAAARAAVRVVDGRTTGGS